MNKLTKLTKVLLAFILSGMGTAAAAFDWPETSLEPYVGLDAQLRDMQYKRNNGGNVFAKQFPQVNGYIGLQFTDCVALELGYEYAFKQNRTVRVGPGQFIVGGAAIAPGEFIDTNTSAYFHGFHGSLVGKLPVWECPNLQLLGTVGVTYLNVHLTSKPFEDIFGPLPAGEFDRTFRQSKFIPRLGIGLQHMLTDCIGMRGMIVWEGTNQFSNIKATQVGVDPSVFASLRGSFNYSLGLFMNF